MNAKTARWLCLILFSQTVVAQEWKVFHTKNSGLPDNQVQAIAIVKDKSGHYWAASEWNVVRFNDAGESSETLELVGTLSSLTVDTAGHIWIGDFNHAEFNGILWKYDGTKLTYDSGNKSKSPSPGLSSGMYILRMDAAPVTSSAHAYGFLKLLHLK